MDFKPENRTRRDEAGVALLEFAVVLPLMVVLVVGIFDFGGAFNVKQKLNNAAQEGARFAATLPTNDLASGTPNSVLAVRNMIDDYMTAEELNDCGLLRAAATGSLATGWSFNANGNGCTGNFSLSIERSYAMSTPLDGINVISTRIFITYPYNWQFGHVIGLIAPGSTFNNGTTISAAAIEPNQD